MNNSFYSCHSPTRQKGHPSWGASGFICIELFLSANDTNDANGDVPIEKNEGKSQFF